ncbi:replication initiation protein RepM [Klebsiella pneumoniae]|uniref:replication initiation protein RepM n=1 Tax=Enterobacteriaceae TaxID=543 RepID=UPI001CE190A9|nr:replication initiation protein RepM [Enterobacter hormaechei]MCA5492142.1 replication initiation protein RepM [Klebsiella pneumoniae]
MGEISVKTGNNARNGGKNSLNRLIRCVCGKKIGPDPRNFNQRVSLGRNDLLIRTFPRLEEQFTKYEIQQISNLTSAYAVRLYEILIAWRSTGKTPLITMYDFRQKIGVLETEYKRMYDFKKYVLDIALKQVNEHTDIIVKVEQHKTGRSITGFSFSFKQKKSATHSVESKRDPNTLDLFSKITDKQRHLFANKLSELPEMSKYSQGTESYQQFAVRIAAMLQDAEKFKELLPLLRKLGFQ